MNIFAIDPGNRETAFVVVGDDFTIHYKEKNENEAILEWLGSFKVEKVVIEMVSSYGKAVGRDVFDTCIWIGRFTQAASALGLPVEYIKRQEVKKHLCNSMNAGDAEIRRVLIDRFARHDMRDGKGTKKEPDIFYGFKGDIWAAFALATTYFDKMNGER